MSSLPAPPERPSKSESAPKQIGRYQVRRVLGLGAMGQVLLAWDPKLGREVAIKIVAAGQRDNPRVKERFVKEAQAIAALNHPNIVQIYDTSDLEHDDLYLVIEKLDGQDLYEAMGQNGMLPESVVVAVGHELCLALEAAHGAGIVHRDLKPENVFLSRNGRVVLTDFGIVKAVRDDSAVPGFRERTEIIGTPGFMAPEQMRGLELTPSIDIFALGALLYNVATLHMPHNGSSPVAIYQAALEGRITDARKHNPMLSEAFCAVIARCLNPNPNKRPSSATEVRLALRGVLDQLGGTDVRDELAQYVRAPQAFAQRSRRRNIDYTVAALVLAEQANEQSHAVQLRERLRVLDPFHERIVQESPKRGMRRAERPSEHHAGSLSLSGEEHTIAPRMIPSRRDKAAHRELRVFAGVATAFFVALMLVTAQSRSQHVVATTGPSAAQIALDPSAPMAPQEPTTPLSSVARALAAEAPSVLPLSSVAADAAALEAGADVELSSIEGQVTVDLDAQPQSTAMPAHLALSPGRHLLVFRAPGMMPLRRQIMVEPREHLKLVADLVHRALMVP